MTVFDFESYKDFVRARVEAMPHNGRGQYRLLAKELRMHTTMVSQVFGGDRELTPEQGCDLCQFWGLNPQETEMFLALLQRERAGSEALKKVLTRQIEALRKKARQLTQRLPEFKKLSPETQSVFYSNWYYSAIRLLTSIPEFRTVDAISEKLQLSRQLVSSVVEFLLEHGLCVKSKKGEIMIGPQRTHLPRESPLVSRHHLNWRVKTLGDLSDLQEHEVLFTSPLSISKKDAAKVAKKIYEFIESVSKVVEDTDPERLCYLNIDWLEV